LKFDKKWMKFSDRLNFIKVLNNFDVISAIAKILSTFHRIPKPDEFT